MPNNAEHIRVLQDYADSKPFEDERAALNAAIRALKAEGKSLWRKVGKKHPGKKWEGKEVWAATESPYANVYRMPMPKIEQWNEYRSRWGIGWDIEYQQISPSIEWKRAKVLWWAPIIWPEHPEKGKVK